MTLLASNHCLADQSLLPLWNTTSSLLSEVWDKPVGQSQGRMCTEVEVEVKGEVEEEGNKGEREVE